MWFIQVNTELNWKQRAMYVHGQKQVQTHGLLCSGRIFELLQRTMFWAFFFFGVYFANNKRIFYGAECLTLQSQSIQKIYRWVLAPCAGYCETT